ncbi:YaaC family protein [Ornithinibacillus salinisoli]|uniref:YaaC family protein n=1 Tax=Ornithinibacillus salinisoli TaxID=1848459 RepID=A0ABW4W1L8_9BACI
MNHKEINSFYTYLQSQQTSQRFLYQCYKKIDGIDAEAKSYENCTVFMYYLDHGIKFYNAGKKLDILMQPILFFYGMVHLLKACLLTKRPNYPESTSVLAHGVSARKRKKKDYTFLEDEVKVQHNGLFPYVSQHLFFIHKMPFEKIMMKNLLGLIPDLSHLFHFNNQESMINVSKIGSHTIDFTSRVLDNYHLTERAFLERIKPYLPPIVEVKSNHTMFQIVLTKPILEPSGPFFVDDNQNIFFPTIRENFLVVSEVMVHYLLLYNLSMLSRYEAEWWGDLLITKPDVDYPFIAEFLRISAKKMPLLIGKELLKMK